MRVRCVSKQARLAAGHGLDLSAASQRNGTPLDGRPIGHARTRGFYAD